MALSPEWAKAVGIFVHKCLELSAQKHLYDFDEVWYSTLAELNISTSPQDQGHIAAYNIAIKQTGDVLADRSWQELFSGAVEVRTEQQVVHLRGIELIRGQIDLLVKDNQGDIQIIDYKTTFIPPGFNTLEALCEEAGYKAQVKSYVEAIRAMQVGNCQVTGGIYFTSLKQLIWVV